MEFFLSYRIYRIYRIFFSFSQFPPARNALACEAGGDETEKGESRSAGEIKPSCFDSMACSGTNLSFEPVLLICRLWRHVDFVLPSPPASPERTQTRDGGQAGRAKEQKNHGNPVYPVCYITEDKLDFSSCEP